MSRLSLPGRHVGSVESISLRSDLIIPREVSNSPALCRARARWGGNDVAGELSFSIKYVEDWKNA